ncbi:retrovirus-related pol polyprotein from transposon TNT 1-94 [Tanacetum coccineum]
MVTAMLISSGMSQDMWGEAILTATYLLNKIPRKEKEETPYELWMRRKPSYQYLRVWGCLAKVDVPTPKAQKIGPKSVDCIFIGYAKNNTAKGNNGERPSKKKMKADGTVDKCKARLVILGFRQREGLDYFDTYSSVTRITSIRTIIAIAALRNLEIHQMDVKTAFLNGDLEEEIYMNQPEGFIAPGQEVKVCRLVKSLYGLKQAPKQWHQKFDHIMLESGFKINECDKCYYVKDTSAGYVILCLYVDDMLIIGSNDKIIRSTKDMLKSKFDMKDMGLADISAVIEGYRDENWISDIKDSRSTSGYVFTLVPSKLKSAMGRAKSTMYNGKFRHIRRRHNSIRQLLSTGVISIDYVVSKDNIADQFTKGLSRELVSKSSKGMGLKPLKECVSMEWKTPN